MLIVSNTRELEIYGLENIKDDDNVRVLGGLNGKEKYNKDKYLNRITYKGRDLKIIINQMKLIESKIPKEWNDWQKSKYIYETLGRAIGYNMDKSTYANQQSSNLSILLSRKAICAGYSLLFKEMMDRQGIECNYIRGRVGRDRHAWNVLIIDRISFPIDLTWDSKTLRRGDKKLQYFGVDENFLLEHSQDQDEKKYDLKILNKNFVNSIDTSIEIKEDEKSEEKTNIIIRNAIKQTYKKYKYLSGNEKAKEQVKEAVKQFITNNDPNYFTRKGNARTNIKNNISPEKMLDFMIETYIGNSIKSLDKSVLGKAIYYTYSKYDEEYAILALKNYIKEGRIRGFTRNNFARENVENCLTPSKAFEDIINKVIDIEIEQIEELEETTEIKFFNVEEFNDFELSNLKKKNIIQKAMEWIKSREERVINPSNEKVDPTRKQNNKEKYR